jgi:hypothetical protein
VSTREIAIEAAPILPVANVEDLLSHIRKLSLEQNRTEFSISAINWIKKWHSEDRIVQDFELLFNAKKGNHVRKGKRAP